MANDPTDGRPVGRTRRRHRLPRLGESLRFYVEDTLRARAKNIGIEHYGPRPSGARARLAIVLVCVVLLAALLIWLSGTLH